VHPRPDKHFVPLVEEERDVVRVGAIDREREDARAVARVRGPEDT
jgi:hypothetical protein